MQNIIKLSINQEEAVSHVNGALLVKASAGSGKTRILTERIKRLLEISKKKVLAITFTNKAGDEMRERLGDSEEIKSRVFVGTFHGFCRDVLEMRGNLIGLSQMPQIFEKESDRLQLVEEAIQATPTFYNDYKDLDEKKRMSFRYDELLTDDEVLAETDDDTFLLYKSYQEILQSQNAIDFDDLIKKTYDLFINNPSVAALYRRTYEYICIDEAQDLNNAQYQLLKSITNGEFKNVMMVGDPNQAIFAFNGSSSDYMNQYFVDDFAPKTIVLDENYRSSKKVIEAAEKIIPSSTKIVNAVIPGVVEITETNDEISEVEWIYNRINELISIEYHDDIEGQITYEKIAVLARNKYVFTKLEEFFKGKNIPYYFKITPGSITFETSTMNVFDLALTVKLNTFDNLHLIRLKKLLNISHGNTLSQFIKELDKEHLIKIIELVINLNADGSNIKLLFKKFSSFMQEYSMMEDDEKKMIINEIEEVIKHWTQYARKTEKESLIQFKNAMALGQTHPLSTPKGITLSTVHTMKGQEYDIVFIMGMDDGTFPDYRAIRNGGVEMTQEKNNTYVAFTRARRFLYVTYPNHRTMPWGDVKARSISRFLKEL
jgi:DNA helicase-2/ATP-dependent DNA helicase PcrA